jgi:parallel beta-helix repeat protein
MYFGLKRPSSYLIQASALANPISSLGKSYVVISDLTVKGGNKYAVTINRGNNVTIKNCNIIFSGIGEASLSPYAHFLIENCTILNSNTTGIAAGSTNLYATSKNNLIKNTYSIAGMGLPGNGQGSGIRIGKTSVAEYNRVIKAGFIGIAFEGDSSAVKNNVIDSFSSVKVDGADIYTISRRNVTNKGRKVRGNIVLNGIGAPKGTISTTSPADGIYIGDNVNGVDVTGNTIANCNRGLYLHNCRNIAVKSNTCFNNNNGQLHVKKDWLGPSIRSQRIINNVFFSKLATQTVASMVTAFNDKDISNWRKFENNYYARPLDDKLIFSNTTFYNSGKEYRINRDLEGWKLRYRLDRSSKRSAKRLLHTAKLI